MRTTKSLIEQFNIQDHGEYFSMICPVCAEHTGFFYKNNPEIIYCNRKLQCGEETSLRTVLQENGIEISPVEFVSQVSSECESQGQQATGTHTKKNLEILQRFFSICEDSLKGSESEAYLPTRGLPEALYGKFGHFPGKERVITSLKGEGFTEEEI